MKTLVLGGARSGKSAYAEKLALTSGLPVTYIATALVGDAEFKQRVQNHQIRRPPDWTVVEEPFFLAQSLLKHAAERRIVLVDCLTLWLAQWICEDVGRPQGGNWETEQEALMSVLPELPGQIIFVSNEVGMGIVPLGEINRRFQDEQGRLNQRVAALCDHAIFMAAGLPMTLK